MFPKFIINKLTITISILVFMSVASLLLVHQHKVHEQAKQKITPMQIQKAPQPQNTVVLSKTTVDELVTKAANQKYLKDVLQASPTLPKDKLAALPPLPTNSVTTNTNPSAGCVYQQQNYVAGDIVKTSQGWIRCTPSIVFNPKRANGAPFWAQVQ